MRYIKVQRLPVIPLPKLVLTCVPGRRSRIIGGDHDRLTVILPRGRSPWPIMKEFGLSKTVFVYPSSSPTARP